jgi:hypothetical protein
MFLCNLPQTRCRGFAVETCLTARIQNQIMVLIDVQVME